MPAATSDRAEAAGTAAAYANLGASNSGEANRGTPSGASFDTRAGKDDLVSKLLWIMGAFAAILAVVAFVAWMNRGRIDRTEREFARRIQDSDAVAKEARLLSKEAEDKTAALQTRLGVLESKLAESQSQQLALEQLYQDLSRTRDDWALAEVEQIVSVASQQLQLAGNVRGAIIGLQNADARLARADKPQFIALRRVIGRDLEQLNALPNIDIAGNALRIDSLLTMVDSLPMVSDEKAAPAPRLDSKPLVQSFSPPPPTQPGKNATGASVGGGAPSASPGLQRPSTPGWTDRIRQSLRYAVAEAWQEVQQLIRVREVEHPDALMIAPDQAYFIRENLKLRLLNARLALLARQESTYRDDLLRAREILQNYFDIRSKQTLSALALLTQVQASTTTIDLPTLSESLSALRNFKAPRER